MTSSSGAQQERAAAGKRVTQAMTQDHDLCLRLMGCCRLQARLFKQQAQGALGLPAELAEAVGALAREERHRLGRAPGARTRQRARRQCLARARLPIEKDAPADTCQMMVSSHITDRRGMCADPAC